MAVENDIVLVYLEDSPVFFARIEAIWADIKKDWYNVELLVLQIPLRTVVWILKDIYINGDEFFMGGKKMRLELVEAPRHDFISTEEGYDNEDEDNNIDKADFSSLSSQKENKSKKRKKSGDIISLADFQKNKK